MGSIIRRQTSGILVPKERCSGITVQGRTIGILGMGHVGKAVARIFHGGLGASIISYDPFLPTSSWPDIPHKRAQCLEDVWAEADIITVHMPLNPQTRGLIAYPQLRAMKRTTIIINTARGGIIDERDLERALSEKLIVGAGLDCHEQEPPSQEKYGDLWELGVVSTPHIGAATAETQILTGMTAARRLLDFILGSTTA